MSTVLSIIMLKYDSERLDSIFCIIGLIYKLFLFSLYSEIFDLQLSIAILPKNSHSQMPLFLNKKD
jgi:hypothetical protein